MAHNARILSDLLFVNGAPIPSAYFQSLDTAQSKAVNGDAGGTWANAGPLSIGGAGMWLCGPSTLSGGASVLNFPSSGARIVHGADDWFGLQVGHPLSTRLLVTPLGGAIDVSPGGIPGNPALEVVRLQYDSTNDAVKTVGNTGISVALGYGARMIVPLRVHHGAVFTSCTFYVLVSAAHNGVVSPPQSMPLFRIFQVDTLGNVTNLPATGATSSVGNGFIQWNPVPVSGAAWYNAGAAQSFAYSLANNVTIDTTRYAYFYEIVDESGANSFLGNEYLCAVAVMTGIPDLRPQ